MRSSTFKHVLKVTGYLGPSGQSAPGLTLADDEGSAKLRTVFKNDRVGLNADAVFSAQNVPTSIFKDASDELPSNENVRNWHEVAWNISVAPLLWVITPTHVRLYDCYASPSLSELQTDDVSPSLDHFAIDSTERLRELDVTCGRLATETGAFWTSSLGAKINRRHRVDRELLAEINALERRLIDLAPQTADPESRRHARDLAQRFIGRCIFTWYLLDRGLAQPFLPAELPADLSSMFATSDKAFMLFDWLRDTFNGDLFPMDDPGAEREHLTAEHLELILDFVEGRSLIPERRGQGRLFRFRFNAIPIDLISAIYQQFARSSATEKAGSQGLHYTPVELIHLTLDPVFEGMPPSARVIDPACGSGAFLVEAFRRLVWRATGGKPATRKLVRKILYHQLYGMDINRSALGIAAFSLYLAALELDEEPINDIDDLKFDHLIDETLFEADSLANKLPNPVTAKSFEAVIGNPPWTFVGQRGGSPKRVEDDKGTFRPRRSPDQAFLRLAAELSGESGRIGMIMKATPFFSKDLHAIEARSALLEELTPVALVNLSYLRREKLFPDAVGPALIFFSRCALATGAADLLVGSIPWTPDFKRTGVFHIGPGEINSVSLDRVLTVPPLLKAAAFGTARDGMLIEKLEKSLPRLDSVLKRLGLDRSRHCGQGFKVVGDPPMTPPDSYYQLRVVTPQTFVAFRVNECELERLRHKTLHRPRRESIFKGPLLLCPKGGNSPAAERGRYSSAVHSNDVLYTENLYGISFRDTDPFFAYVLSGILNSSLTTFQFALGGSTWGLERPTVGPHDLLSLRVPWLENANRTLIDAVADAERKAAEEPDDRQRLAALDESVFDLYALEREERVLAADSVARARHLIFESRKERTEMIKPPDGNALREYAGQAAQTVNAYLRARGRRHIEAVIYEKDLEQDNPAIVIPGITVVRFTMAPGGPESEPVVREGKLLELNSLASMLHGLFETDAPPYLNERRQLRIYGSEDLFILKPTEVRYWTRTASLNDADTILADHWLQS